jgi:hypothetical protein
MPTIFFLITFLSNDNTKGNYLIKLGTLSVFLFELAHPLLGKSIDIWDIVATIMMGFISYLIYNSIFSDKQLDQKTISLLQVIYSSGIFKFITSSWVRSII